MSWAQSTLGEVADIFSGYAFKSADMNSEGGTPLIKIKNIADSAVSHECDAFLNKDFNLAKFERFHLLRDDFLVAMTGQGSVGRIGKMRDYKPGFYVNQRVAIVRVNPEKANPVFIFYQIATRSNELELFKKANGAGQPNISAKQIGELPVVLPSTEQQQYIADVLSSYDDLIENNQKQIKLLEEAAQRLYKEWFVDLRFPGHETTPITDGIPEGWKRKTVAECLSFHGNGGWGKETPIGKNEHPGKVIRGTDIEDIKAGRFSDVPLRYHTDNDIKKRVLKNCDLVFELSNGNINNIGRCLLVDDLVLRNCGENTICASFCKLLRPIDCLHSLVLYWEIQDMQTSGRMLPLKKHGANGINNFDFDGFLNHELLIPGNAEMLAPIEAIMAKISMIQGQFALLTEARDRLLPKLMSGEIEV